MPLNVSCNSIYVFVNLNNVSNSLGEQSYGAIEYRGTWFVTDSTATDYVGFVFGYQNNRKFYLVTWKRTHSNYDVSSTYRVGIKGLQLKVSHLILILYTTIFILCWLCQYGHNVYSFDLFKSAFVKPK